MKDYRERADELVIILVLIGHEWGMYLLLSSVNTRNGCNC